VDGRGDNCECLLNAGLRNVPTRLAKQGLLYYRGPHTCKRKNQSFVIKSNRKVNKSTQSKLTQQPHKSHMWGPLTLIHALMSSVVLSIFTFINRLTIVNGTVQQKYSDIYFFILVYMCMRTAHVHLSPCSFRVFLPDPRRGSALDALGSC